jgi:hypothetical protein
LNATLRRRLRVRVNFFIGIGENYETRVGTGIR